jgi:hypothetical protein
MTNALADYTGGNAIVGEASPRLAASQGQTVPVATVLRQARPHGRRGCCSRRPSPELHVPLARPHPHGGG